MKYFKREELNENEIIRDYLESNLNFSQIAEKFKTNPKVVANIVKDYICKSSTSECVFRKAIKKMDYIYFKTLENKKIFCKTRTNPATDKLIQLRKSNIQNSEILSDNVSDKSMKEYWKYLLEGDFLLDEFPYSREEIEENILFNLERATR